MEGVREILIDCIDAFPEIRDDYVENKSFYKSRLQPHMRALRNKLADRDILSQFFYKALFNASEVVYLTVLDYNHFHVFHRQDVLHVLSTQIAVENSKARHRKQTSDLKVVFKVGTTLGEIEMRTDSKVHFREVKFWLLKDKTLDLLIQHISPREVWHPGQLSVYGKAIRRFAPNHKPK